jgi:hypothetical protein
MAVGRLQAFDAALRAAGIPIDGVSLLAQPPGPQTIEVQYRDSATAEQRAQGQAILEGFDFRPRRDLTRLQVVQGIAQLTTAQQAALRNHLLARVLANLGGEAAEILSGLGLPLAIDEVDPTPM